MAKKTLLRNLKVTRVDLVDKGASQDPASGEGAHVLLYKRDGEEGAQGDDAVEKGTALACPHCDYSLPTRYTEKGMELPNYCPECGAGITLSASGGTEKGDKAMKFEKSSLKGEALAAFEALEKANAELAAKLAKAEKEPEPEKTDVLKGVSPEVRAIVEKAERESAEAKASVAKANEEIAKLVDSQRLVTFTKAAEVITHVPGWTPAEGGKILKALHDHCPEEAKRVEELLKAASDAIKASPMFKTLGAPGGQSNGADSAEAEVNAKVQEMVSKGEVKTAREALRKVFEEDPALYERYRDESTVKVSPSKS